MSYNEKDLAAHMEHHYIHRSNWLRAAVLGANDGIISVTSLIIGVASAGSDTSAIALAGIAGLVSGAMSMAAGEYVSVSSQTDLEQADLEKEAHELKVHPKEELQELVYILQTRGMDEDLATKAAIAMTEHDALTTHAREELGMSEITEANPLQAAFASGTAFSAGAIIPTLSVFLFPQDIFIACISVLCIVLLGTLGALAAKTGGSGIIKPALRVMFWGMLAMGFSYIVGDLVGTNL